MSLEQLLCSSSEVAELLGVSRSMFYSRLSSGEIGILPTVKWGRKKLFEVEKVRAYVRAGCPCREKWLQMQDTNG